MRLVGASFIALVAAVGIAGVPANPTPTPTPAPSMSNTSPPTIVGDVLLGNNVVGAVLQGMPGTWSGAPTSFTYQWLRDGSVISGATSASYTLVEADRTKVISLAVIATKSGETSAPAFSAATAAVRRTAAMIGIRYGRLSRAGYGKVALASATLGLLGRGVAAPASWAVGAATTGADAHFTRAVDVTPVASGNASVTGATYVFPLTATFSDSVVETSELTITAVADVVTINPANEADWMISGIKSVVEGKTIEIATGTPSAQAISMKNFRGATYTTVRYADAARPTPLRFVEARGAAYVIFEGLRTVSDTLSPKVSGYFYVSDNGVDGIASDHITFNSPVNVSDIAHVAAHKVSGTGASPSVLRVDNGDYITFNDAYGDGAYGGFQQGAVRATNITVNRAVFRHFADNGIIVGSANGVTSVVFNDTLILSPIRIPGDNTHTDGVQIADIANGGTITFNRTIIVQADGNGGSQGYQIGGGGGPTTIVINGLIVVIGRQYNGILCAKANANIFKNITMWKTTSGDVTVADPLVDAGPWMKLVNSTESTGVSTVDSCVVFNQFINEAGSSFTAGSRITAYNGTLSSPPTGVAGVAFAGDPTALLNALTTAQWAAMTPAQIKAYVMDALKPKAGGPIADRGAIGTDGNWIADALAA